MTKTNRKSIPYETATAGQRALMELQNVLAKFDCQQFGTMVDNEHGETIVNFRWRERNVSLRASWKGYAEVYLQVHPIPQYTWGEEKQKKEQAAIEQAKLSVASVLRDWVKGQITAVECGVMSFEAAFMPHMLLATGERVIDRISAHGGMLALEHKGVEAGA